MFKLLAGHKLTDFMSQQTISSVGRNARRDEALAACATRLIRKMPLLDRLVYGADIARELGNRTAEVRCARRAIELAVEQGHSERILEIANSHGLNGSEPPSSRSEASAPPVPAAKGEAEKKPGRAPRSDLLTHLAVLIRDGRDERAREAAGRWGLESELERVAREVIHDLNVIGRKADAARCAKAWGMKAECERLGTQLFLEYALSGKFEAGDAMLASLGLEGLGPALVPDAVARLMRKGSNHLVGPAAARYALGSDALEAIATLAVAADTLASNYLRAARTARRYIKTSPQTADELAALELDRARKAKDKSAELLVLAEFPGCASNGTAAQGIVERSMRPGHYWAAAQLAGNAHLEELELRAAQLGFAEDVSQGRYEQAALGAKRHNLVNEMMEAGARVVASHISQRDFKRAKESAQFFCVEGILNAISLSVAQEAERSGDHTLGEDIRKQYGLPRARLSL